jgi:hypothetical protein
VIGSNIFSQWRSLVVLMSPNEKSARSDRLESIGSGMGASTPSNRKPTNSRDTQGSTIRGAAEFGEAIITEPRQSIQVPVHHEAITAHGYSQMQVASFLGFHDSTIN